jgi:hypothetical protein
MTVEEAEKTTLMDRTRKMFQEETGGKVLFITKELVFSPQKLNLSCINGGYIF